MVRLANIADGMDTGQFSGSPQNTRKRIGEKAKKQKIENNEVNMADELSLFEWPVVFIMSGCVR